MHDTYKSCNNWLTRKMLATAIDALTALESRYIEANS